jgi:hypothetical protein
MKKASNISGVLPRGAPVGTIAFSSLAPRGWDLYISDVQTGIAAVLPITPPWTITRLSPPTAKASPLFLSGMVPPNYLASG